MRISDWSSDVCSSDLGRERQISTGREPSGKSYDACVQIIEPLEGKARADQIEPDMFGKAGLFAIHGKIMHPADAARRIAAPRDHERRDLKSTRLNFSH